MQKPPTKGYVPWDKGTFERLVSGTPEPLASRFEVTHGTLLACLQGTPQDSSGRPRGGGYKRLVGIIGRSHGNPHQHRTERRRAAACLRALRHAGIVEVVPYESARGRIVQVSSELQRDFSLHQTLSLYLHETVGLLDRESPTYAVDVLSLVEAIVENPDAVLRKQLDRLKTEAMAEMKAAGVEYEERIERLDAMEWPKPNREFIYDSFNAFAERHPWVGAENVRPKSIAREMYEGFASFDDYVRSLGLERSEGVLLRYLSQVWKTMTETVPAPARTEEVMDILAHFRVLVREIDSSLIEEWESLRTPRARSAVAAARAAVDPVLERRALFAAIRAEVHRICRALSRARGCRSGAAARAGRRGALDGGADRRRHGSVLGRARALSTTPDARRPDRTRIEEIAPGRFRVQQTLVDAEGDEDWALHGVVDTAAERGEGSPRFELDRIGT